MQLRLACAMLLALTSVARAQGLKLNDRVELGAYTDSDHVSVVTPSLQLGLSDDDAGYGLNARYTADVVSAASVDITASASRPFHELRHAFALDGRVQRDDVRASAVAGVSSEPDYLSLSAALQGALQLRAGDLTLALGYAAAHDTAGRTGTPFRVFSRELMRHVFSAGASIVLDPSSVLWLGLDFTFERGDAAKPYRYVPMFDAKTAAALPNGASAERVAQQQQPLRSGEAVPHDRKRYAITLRYARRSGAFAIRAEERLYVDTWRMFASSLDLRGALDLTRRVELGLTARVHAQTGVSFWRRAYVAQVNERELRIPALRTADRELGPLWTVTLGGDVRYALNTSFAAAQQALGVRVALMRTGFLDTLLIAERFGLLVALTADGSFE